MNALFILPTIICFGIGGYMALNGVGGWGWFLFIGLLTFCYPAGKDEDA